MNSLVPFRPVPQGRPDLRHALSYLCAQSDSAMEISECTPWQRCRTYGLDLYAPSTVTGVRGAAGGRQPGPRGEPCLYTL